MKPRMSDEQLEFNFRADLQNIENSLATVNKGCSFWGRRVRESSQKILNRSDALSGDAAQEMVKGLNELLNFLVARVKERHALLFALGDRQHVPPETIGMIMKHPAMECVPSQLWEDLSDLQVS